MLAEYEVDDGDHNDPLSASNAAPTPTPTSNGNKVEEKHEPELVEQSLDDDSPPSTTTSSAGDTYRNVSF